MVENQVSDSKWFTRSSAVSWSFHDCYWQNRANEWVRGWSDYGQSRAGQRDFAVVRSWWLAQIREAQRWLRLFAWNEISVISSVAGWDNSDAFLSCCKWDGYTILLLTEVGVARRSRVFPCELRFVGAGGFLARGQGPALRAGLRSFIYGSLRLTAPLRPAAARYAPSERLLSPA